MRASQESREPASAALCHPWRPVFVRGLVSLGGKAFGACEECVAEARRCALPLYEVVRMALTEQGRQREVL